jgi:predicted nuclease of predicted toxin-antitoxin system
VINGAWTRPCCLSNLCETPSARSGPAALHGRFAEPGGWGVVHACEIGMSRADDREILRRGRADSRVCARLDADFHSLLATSGERGPSLIRIWKEGLDATALAALLQTVWPRVEDALDSGALVLRMIQDQLNPHARPCAGHPRRPRRVP